MKIFTIILILVQFHTYWELDEKTDPTLTSVWWTWSYSQATPVSLAGVTDRKQVETASLALPKGRGKKTMNRLHLISLMHTKRKWSISLVSPSGVWITRRCLQSCHVSFQAVPRAHVEGITAGPRTLGAMTKKNRHVLVHHNQRVLNWIKHVNEWAAAQVLVLTVRQDPASCFPPFAVFVLS